jgi:hypothetical protein
MASMVNNYGLTWAAFLVFDEDAGVFNGEKARCTRDLASGCVHNAKLKPDDLCMDGDGGFNDRSNVCRPAEDVNEIDGLGDVFEAGV